MVHISGNQYTKILQLSKFQVVVSCPTAPEMIVQSPHPSPPPQSPTALLPLEPNMFDDDFPSDLDSPPQAQVRFSCKIMIEMCGSIRGDIHCTRYLY